VKAHGKVNLCLLVGAPRSDGLHPLVSVFQPTDLADEVTMEPDVRDSVVCPGVEGDNLALRALTEFRASTGWDGPPQRIVIEKRIPVAGGMAGGSGEHVEPIAGVKPPLVVVPLDARLTAAQVYRTFDILGLARSDEELASLRDDPPPVNDLEPAARRLCQAIDPALEALARAGAEHPLVSGSGPTVFGRAGDPERVVARLAEAGYPGALQA
jgi:4-diphosphocytidyl-2-C-methyl-D-erythritol kinase